MTIQRTRTDSSAAVREFRATQTELTPAYHLVVFVFVLGYPSNKGTGEGESEGNSELTTRWYDLTPVPRRVSSPAGFALADSKTKVTSGSLVRSVPCFLGCRRENGNLSGSLCAV